MIENKETIIEYLKKTQIVFKYQELEIIISLLEDDCKINLKKLQDSLFPSLSKPSLKASFSKFKKDFNEMADKNSIDIVLQTNHTSRKVENNFCFFEYNAKYSDIAKDEYSKDSTRSFRNDEFINSKAQKIREKTIFVSFAFKDNAEVQLLVEKLEKYLNIINENVKIKFWKCDNEILAGENIQEEVEQAINECDFGLLALSPNFFNSTFIEKYELPKFINDSPKHPILVSIKSVDIKYDCMKDLNNHFIFSKDGKDFQSLQEKDKEKYAEYLANDILKIIQKNDNSNKIEIQKYLVQVLHKRFNEKEFEGTRANKINSSATSNKELNITNSIEVVPYIIDWVKKEKEKHYFALLGESGMGKTWTCMKITYDLLQEHKDDKIDFEVFYLDLRYFSSNDNLSQVFDITNIIKTILNKALTSFDKNISLEHILKIIKTKKTFIIFDGLDEVLVHLKDEVKAREFITELKKIININPNNKILLSCRTEYFIKHSDQFSYLEDNSRDETKKNDFTVLSLIPFSKEQIQSYCKKIRIDFDTFYNLITSIHNLLDMAKKPFTLKLLTSQLNKLQSIENTNINSAHIYFNIIDEWLLRDGTKHTIDQHTYKPMIMRDISAYLHTQSTRSIPYTSLTIWIDKWLEEHSAIANRYKNISTDILHTDIRTATFISRPGIDEFMFAHTSLQEFFLAWNIQEKISDNDIKGLSQILEHNLPSYETIEFFLNIILTKEIDTQKQIVKQINNTIIHNKKNNPLSHFFFECFLIIKNLYLNIDIKIQGIELKSINMKKRKFENIKFENIKFKNIDFYGAYFINCSFYKCSFKNTSIINAELINISFLDCKFEKSDFRASEFKDCIFDDLEIKNTDTTFANFYDCMFEQKDLRKKLLNDIKSNYLADKFSMPLILSGHSSYVRSVAFSQDNKYMASGSYDNSVKIYDMKTLELVKSFEDHSSNVTSVAFSQDNKYMASGSYDNSVKIYDMKTLELVKSFEDHSRVVASVAFSQDNKYMASGSYDNSVKIYDMKTLELVKSFEDHSSNVTSVAFSQDNKYMASGSYDNSVKIYDMKTLELVKSFEDHSSDVTSVAFSQDNKYMASGSYDSSVKIYDMKTLELVKSFEDHSSNVTSVAFSQDNKYMASGSYDSSVKIYDMKTLELVKSFEDHSSYVTSVAFSQDNKYMASGSYDSSVKIYDMKTLELVKSFEDHSSNVTSVAFSQDNKYMASGSYDNSVKIYNMKTLELVKSFEDHSSNVTSVAFSQDNKYMASGSYDSSVKIYDMKTLELVKSFEDHSSDVTSVAFSQDNKYMASGSYDSSVKIYDMKTLELVKSFEDHSRVVASVAFSQDNKYMASGSYDSSVKIYDMKTLELVKSFEDHSSDINSVAFSQDNKYMASGSYDNSVKIYDMKTLELVKSFEDHSRVVASVAFSQDNKYMASGSYDSSVKIYDMKTLELVKSFEDHSSDINSVAFSQDNKYMASGSDDGNIKIYKLDDLLLHSTITVIGKAVIAVDEVKSKFKYINNDNYKYLRYMA